MPSFFLVFTPFVAFMVAGFVGFYTQPGPKIRSILQHTAAGIIFGAVGVELLPIINKSDSKLTIAFGFLIGMGLMLLIKFLAHPSKDESSVKVLQRGIRIAPLGLLVGLSIDLFVDGLLIGMSFVAGAEGGLIVAVAILFEICFLALALASTFVKRKLSYRTVLATIFLLGLLVPVGIRIGAAIAKILPPIWMTGFIAFGIAALLYLVTEELLIEAHEEKDTPFETAAFFIGFLAIILL